MPPRKGPPGTQASRQRAPKGANPEVLSLDVPEGWTGKGGALAEAASAAGLPSGAEWVRQTLAAALRGRQGP
jgi:hypothetical protein